MKDFFRKLSSWIFGTGYGHQEAELASISKNSVMQPSNIPESQDPAKVLEEVKNHIAQSPLYKDQKKKFAEINDIDAIIEDTPLLSWAIIKEDDKLALKLIEAGANLNAVDLDNFTPLHEASKKGNTKIITALKEKGADPTIKTQIYGSEHSGLAGDLTPKTQTPPQKSAMPKMFETVKTFKNSFSTQKTKQRLSIDDGRF